MSSASLQSPFGAKALLHDKGILLNPKAGPFRVSTYTNSNFLRLEPSHSLGSLYYFRICADELKSFLKLRTKNIRQSNRLVSKSDYPQNTDLPKYHSRRERKPFPVPIVELRRAARARLKRGKRESRRTVPPPKRGLLVKSLIPLAYDVLNARTLLINNLKRLLKVVPVLACRWCNEIHVGPVGHPFRTCSGQRAVIRKGAHDWTNAIVEDILVPIEAFHLHDRLGRRITHNERFYVPRIPALVELCIQAGVDLPEFPTKRRRKPIIHVSKGKFIDADETELPDPDPDSDSAAAKLLVLSETPSSEIVTPPEAAFVAEETLRAWQKMRAGAKKLMTMYPVRVCGYCPEVHVGPMGHKAQNCGAFKHQQRNGQHGWQMAVLDDLVPPRYVWHVPDVDGPPLQRELRRFYGKAPVVVELCARAGAAVPEQYKATMRLDVGIPANEREAEMVA